MTSVLIVDDHPLNLNLARIVLSRAGFDVTTASSAAEALKSVDRARPDVVLTDISMPVTSGKELCALLHAKFGPRRPRIVAYTAMVLENEQREMFAWGFDGIVTKPATAKALVGAIRTVEV